ncbi:MAG: alkaline phosphatase family protein [Desulfobacterales bacterium]|nr:alkaline phosphatase family protein [Desulfobacterales bacterium]
MTVIDNSENPLLSEMTAVGMTEPFSARLWLRSHQSGRIRVTWHPEGDDNNTWETIVEIPEENEHDNTAVIRLPPENGSAPPLVPMHRYRFRAYHADGRLIGKGGFETAPETPEQYPSDFSIALMSCHQPFNMKGELTPESSMMLKAARQCMKEHNIKYVLTTGDQVYSDYPPALSLFSPKYFASEAPKGRQQIQDCTPGEIRQLFHQHYRLFWNLPEWKAIHSEFPCYPMLDDHDIVNNWGSVPEHQLPEWQKVGQGARMAYFDYQGSRVLNPGKGIPDDFHYKFTYGPSATFVMDIRSNRVAGDNGQLYSSEQEASLIRFLSQNQERRIIFIVLSVPVIHIPRFLARVAAWFPRSPEDFSDRWSSPAHIRDRDRFLKIIHEHQQRFPFQRIVLLSGDIHMACVHQIQWHSDAPVMYQMISSGITHCIGFFMGHASDLLIRMNRRISTEDKELTGKLGMVRGIRGKNRNPYKKLNLGIIEVSDSRLRFHIYGHKKGTPYCAFRSEFI